MVAGGGGPTLNATTGAAPTRLHDDKTTYTGVHVSGGPTTIDHRLTLDSLADRSDADVRGVKKHTAYANADAGLSSGRHAGLSPGDRAKRATTSPGGSAAHGTPRSHGSPDSAAAANARSPARSAAKRAPPVSVAAPHGPAPPNYFDLLTRYFMRHNPAKASNVGVLLTQYSGNEHELFAKMEAKYGDPVIPHASAHGASPKKTTIYDKLTDASLYTGAHKERFDASTGKGLGLGGRDFTSKGGAGGRATGAHGFSGDTNTKTDTVYHDSSQFLMR